VGSNPFRYRRQAIRGSAALLLGALLSMTLAAQKRPTLRVAPRDYFAGRLLLIPANALTRSYELPRQLARVADHDLLLPPFELVEGGKEAASQERLWQWIKAVDYSKINGMIVSVTDASAGRIKGLRAQHSQLQIYGYGASAETIIDLVANGSLNCAIVSPADQSGIARLEAQIVERNLSDRILVEPKPESSSVALIARMLNYRFKMSPRVMTIFSSPAGSSRDNTGDPRDFAEIVVSKIRQMNGVVFQSPNDTTAHADILFFVHTPGTTDQQRTLTADTVAEAVSKGYRVAFADASGSGAATDQMLEELRKRKLLDQLTSWAACAPAGKAIGLALAHASARTDGLKFLRNNTDRVQRLERAQVEFIFGRLLVDWAYEIKVRPRVEAVFKETAANDSGSADVHEKAESLAATEVKVLAAKLFDEQFRRSIHSILLNSGERAYYEVRALQRFSLRLPQQSIEEADVRQSVYVPFTGN
jgi:hypothetical protein